MFWFRVRRRSAAEKLCISSASACRVCLEAFALILAFDGVLCVESFTSVKCKINKPSANGSSNFVMYIKFCSCNFCISHCDCVCVYVGMVCKARSQIAKVSSVSNHTIKIKNILYVLLCFKSLLTRFAFEIHMQRHI